MKSVRSLPAILLFAVALNCQAQDEIKNPVVSTADSVEYELLVIDPGFETWLITKPSAEFYSQNYYEQWNLRYVMEWNSRYLTNPARYPEIGSYIDYLPGTDYGLELNYRLYWYFIYFEETNGITLVKRGRR